MTTPQPRTAREDDGRHEVIASINDLLAAGRPDENFADARHLPRCPSGGCGRPGRAADPRIDAFTRLAAAHYRACGAAFVLADAKGRIMKSASGRGDAAGEFAAAWMTRLPLGETLLVEDVDRDPRLAPVAPRPGGRPLRFVASVPVHDADGRGVGALAIIDYRPRHLGRNGLGVLREVARGIAAVLRRDRRDAAKRRFDLEHRHAIELSGQGIWSADSKGRLLGASSGWLSMSGLTLPEARADWMASVHPEDRPAVEQAWRDALAAKSFFQMAYRAQVESGRYRWVRNRAALRPRPQGSAARWYGALEDIDEWMQGQLELLRLQARLTHVLDHTKDYVCFISRGECVTYVNKAAHSLPLFQGPAGRSLGEMGLEATAPELVRRIRQANADREEICFEWFDGSTGRWIEQHLYPTPEGVSVFGRDTTERHVREEEQERHRATLYLQARHDSLTGVLNRTAFREAVERRLADRAPFALLFIDLDGFKGVNDTLGHAVGDEVLRKVVRRLSRCVGPQDCLARFGGDEFALLQAGDRQSPAVEELAGRVVSAVGGPFDIGGVNVVVGASVGVAVAGEDGTDRDALFKAADIAMYAAKASGGNAWKRFRPSMQVEVETNELLRKGLRSGIRDGQMFPVFQPLVDLRSSRVSGFEALLRWRHPVLGLVPPSQFIPVAEESGAIAQIGEWVLGLACREAAGWPDPVRVAVNVSARQLVADFPDAVRRALGETGLRPDRLQLEVTETALLEDGEAHLKHLHDVRSQGVLVVLDDFGTGFSSLSYLQQFPFDEIKIDRSFVRDLTSRRDKQAIVRSVIHLARELGIEITAEGVEAAGELEWLRQAGCARAQGFLLGRPMSAADAPVHLRTWGMNDARHGEGTEADAFAPG